jgi:hypothetical protein
MTCLCCLIATFLLTLLLDEDRYVVVPKVSKMQDAQVINLLFTIFQYDEYYIYDHFSADTLES